MELQMEYGEDVEQPESTDDNDQDQTPLSGRTRSARASQSRPRRIVIPSAVIPDDSEDLDSDDDPSSVTKARPKSPQEQIRETGTQIGRSQETSIPTGLLATATRHAISKNLHESYHSGGGRTADSDSMDLIQVGVSVTCSRKKESSESGRTGCRAAARPVYNSTARLG
jgi:hypothetical protein